MMPSGFDQGDVIVPEPYGTGDRHLTRTEMAAANEFRTLQETALEIDEICQNIVATMEEMGAKLVTYGESAALLATLGFTIEQARDLRRDMAMAGSYELPPTPGDSLGEIGAAIRFANGVLHRTEHS
jgi:hypothetical protein